VHAVNSIVRKWKFSPITPGKGSSSLKTNENMSRPITSGFESNSTDGAGSHGIVVLLMGMNILKRHQFAVGCEADLSVEDNFPRTQSA